MANEFNAALKNLRKSRGITQEQLAEAVGVSPQAVSKWEMNGYPDAPLLPVIADYLGVSIDELFGNEREEISIEQRVLEHFKNTPSEKRFDRAMRICEAIGCGMFGSEEYIPFKLTVTAPDEPFNDSGTPYSQQETDGGLCQSRFGKKLRYFLLMPEPEGGFDSFLSYNDKYVELYRFLSIPNALRAMYLFAGKGKNTYFSVSSVVKELGIDKNSAAEIIEGMEKLNFAEKADLNTGEGSGPFTAVTRK